MAAGSGPGLLLPDHVLQDLWLGRSFVGPHNLTPGEISPLFDTADVDAVAWAGCGTLPGPGAGGLLAVVGVPRRHPGPGPACWTRALAALLGLPGELQAHVHPRSGRAPAAGPSLRALDHPRGRRGHRDRRGSAPPSWEPAGLAQEAIARCCFPATLEARSAVPPCREILRAVWLLHENFTARARPHRPRLDRVMSIMAAYTYGVRQPIGMLRLLDRGPPRAGGRATPTRRFADALPAAERAPRGVHPSRPG